jgi:hypothetical protein
MRFHRDGPAIPDILLNRCDDGRVVFLCGAGVSSPSGMPNFVGLTQHVIELFAPSADSEIMAAFQPWLSGQSAVNVPLDQIFNLLHQEYGKDEVNALVTQRLNTPSGNSDLGHAHHLIKRISSNQNGVAQIVTTNFDRLFELGQSGEHLACHIPPAFPDLNFGSKIEGITYLHGRLVDADSESHPYVLSSADFGRAYLSEGWATNFIRHLLEQYTVVLVGYQAEDPPIKYLLLGLNHDGKYDRSRLYAFDRGIPEEIEAKWRDRGVTAIAYATHADLWKSMEAWADRADDPRKWRASIIANGWQDPKTLAPHERGQVAHILRTTQGAKLFAQADPAPHPEWICVMDAYVRSAKPGHSYDESTEVFDPRVAYGLDDDLSEISDEERAQGTANDNLLAWRSGEDSPHDAHRLDGRPDEGFETLPKRLGHLVTWIGKSLDSPVLAWWATRKRGLHPRLLREIEGRLEVVPPLHERGRHIWRLILEHQRDPRNRQFGGDWFDLRKRVAAGTWSPSTLRELRRVSMPRIDIKPPFGRAQAEPPNSTWENVSLYDIGQFDVKLLDRHGEDVDVPDAAVPAVMGIVQDQLSVASGLLADIEPVYFQTPSCYPDLGADRSGRPDEDAEFVLWFVELFNRMADLRPDLAIAHATTWSFTERHFFRKLKLFALGKSNLFAADDAARTLLSLDQASFWDTEVARELLLSLVGRWRAISPSLRDQLVDRILAGPDRLSDWTDEDFPSLRDRRAARYARYLELQGCELTKDRGERLAVMISNIPDWSDGWATSTVSSRESHGGWVVIDESPEALMTLPVNQVIARARQDVARGFADLNEKQSFTGLVKADPRKSLSALTVAGKADDYPLAFWSSLIDELPKDLSPRLRRVFLHRVARLPHAVIAGLARTLCRWLERDFAELLGFDDALAWAVYDHIVGGILAGGADVAKSGLGEVLYGGQSNQRSRRTFEHAINGAVGMCATALLRALPTAKEETGSSIPGHIRYRYECLSAAPGEGADHAVSIATRHLNRLMSIDPEWTTRRLVPLLALDHPAAEPAWNGFLHGRNPAPQLAALIKPTLLAVIPWLDQFSWDRDYAEVAAQWVGYMRIFNPDESCGLSKAEMRATLRMMSDDTRNRLVFWLGRVGQKNERGWADHVVPFVRECWPTERRYRTAASMRAWIGLLDDTGDSFPVMYEAVKTFLVRLQMDDHLLYRFTREIGTEQTITALFPGATLDMMDRITPEVLTRVPYELPKILAIIAESAPGITVDPRYLRLMDLVERS